MPPLVSCLCVTEGRSAFLPWLVWNWAKQDHPAKELVVVGPDLPVWLGYAGVRTVPTGPGLRVATKRNLALEAARGSHVAWFDDDDWQHPRRLSTLLAVGAPVAGGLRGWFVRVDAGAAALVQQARSIVFNGLVAERAVCGRFDETLERAADTPWTSALPTPVVVPGVWSMWLVHGGNLSNPSRLVGERWGWRHHLADVVADVGAEAWAGTDGQLAALRHRLRIN